MGREPPGRGVGASSKAGEELPDLGIHPPLGLIHLGAGRGRTEKRSREGRKGCHEALPPPGLHQAQPAACSCAVCSQVLMPDALAPVPIILLLLMSLVGLSLDGPS